MSARWVVNTSWRIGGWMEDGGRVVASSDVCFRTRNCDSPIDDLKIHTIMCRDFKIFCCSVIYSAATQREHVKTCRPGVMDIRNRPIVSKRRGKEILLECAGKLKSIVAVPNCHLVVTAPDRKNPSPSFGDVLMDRTFFLADHNSDTDGH